MINLGAIVFSQADEQHLHKPAFNLASKSRMRLDTIVNQDMAGFEGKSIEVHIEAFSSSTDDDRFHA